MHKPHSDTAIYSKQAAETLIKYVGVDNVLKPLRRVLVALVGLNTHCKPTARQPKKRTRQTRRADLFWERQHPPRRPRSAEVVRIGKENCHRQTAFGLIVEESVFNEDRGAETVNVVWFDDGDVTAEATIDLCDPEHEYLEIISESR